LRKRLPISPRDGTLSDHRHERLFCGARFLTCQNHVLPRTCQTGDILGAATERSDSKAGHPVGNIGQNRLGGRDVCAARVSIALLELGEAAGS
jgi:hypothetical protein